MRLGDIVPLHLVAGGLKLGELVGKTYGPKGGTVLLDRLTGLLQTSDGYMVAQEITLPGPIQDLGVQILKKAAREVSERTGDGTTTTILVACGALRKGLKLLQAGWNPQELSRELEAVLPILESGLRDMALAVDRDLLRSVALSSSRGDEVIADRVVEAVMTCGEGGTVLVFPGESTGMELEVRDGLKLDTGWVSSEMGHGETERVLESVLVVLTPYRLDTMDQVAPFLEEAGNRGLPVLVACGGLWGKALSTMLLNDKEGVVSSAAINLFPKRMDSILDVDDKMGDLAALTGGTVISSMAGLSIEKFDPAWFGTARKIVLAQDSCTIWGYSEHEEKISQRVFHLRTLAAKVAAEGFSYDRDRYLERAAALDGGLVILKVGGFTEAEAKERRGRVEDAVRASQCALAHGVVPGAGVALGALAELCSGNYAGEVIKSALLEPFGSLCQSSDGVVHECDGNIPWTAYDPVQQVERDFLQEPRIVDPFDVVWDAFRTGISSAMSILSCGVVIHGKH